MGRTKRFLSLILVLACLLLCVPATQAAGEWLPNELFLTQDMSGTCTLCSAAMMVRSCLYINGNAGWMNVTESSLKTVAWRSGVGLKWNFTYTTEEATVSVGHQGVSGFTVDSLKALLDKHPEGIVLYCGNLPHAVFLFGYEGDTFYCAETVSYYSGEAIPLADSWLGIKYGSQSAVLSNATAYWYISEYERADASDCDCSAVYAGTYVCTTTTSSLRMRGGHSTKYSVVGSIPAGAAVKVTKISGEGKDAWAHVTYNGVSGYASMQYLSLVELDHNYETTVVAPTCTAKGYTIHTCTDCGNKLMESMTDPVGHAYGAWTASGTAESRTCTNCGAVETREVTAAVMGTVTGSDLRIREGAGTSYKTVGFLQKGDRVEILEQKTVGSTTWGRMEKGWIAMSYVKLDEIVSETPAEPEVTEPETTEPETTEPETTEPEQTSVMGTVTGSDLRIREGAGTSYKTVGLLQKGDRVEIFESVTVNGLTWGRIEAGWTCLSYVELDAVENENQTRTVTVNTACLRIRSSATTSSSIVGFLYQGAKVEILETKTVGGTTWGRTEKGWISMDYVI